MSRFLPLIAKLGEEKKMSSTHLHHAYIPAVLRENQDWYIEFSYQSLSGSMIRVRSKLNRILKRFKTKAEKRAFAQKEVSDLNAKLSTGWTPEFDKIVKSNSYAATLWKDVSSHYLEYLEKAEKSNLISHSTILTYKSTFSIFCSFLSSRPESLKFVYQLDESVIKDFLNWSVVKKHLSSTTVGNYKRYIHTLCEWLKECGYLNDNPAVKVKNPLSNRRSQIDQKAKIKSTYIDEHTRKRIFDWLTSNDPHLKLAVLLCHHCFLRPKEIAQLKIENFHLHDSLIFVPRTISKNHIDAYITLPDEISRLMLDLRIFEFPGEYYLFNRQLVPEYRETPCRGDEIRERWRQMCRTLHIPDTVWLYHMKHTGITDMTELMPEKLVQLQARHSSIQMTERYVQQKPPKANPLIKSMKEM